MDDDNQQLAFDEDFIEEDFEQFEVMEEAEDTINERMTESANTFNVVNNASFKQPAQQIDAVPMNQSLNKEQPKTVTFQSDMKQSGLAQANRAALVSESPDFPTQGSQQDKPRMSEKVANHLVNYVGLADPLKAGKASDNLFKNVQ